MLLLCLGDGQVQSSGLSFTSSLRQLSQHEMVSDCICIIAADIIEGIESVMLRWQLK